VSIDVAGGCEALSLCHASSFPRSGPLAVNTKRKNRKKPRNKMPEKMENLETLIDNILQDEGPMTLADLINLIAQPHSYDRFCLAAV
jgi:hypothetical protein